MSAVVFSNARVVDVRAGAVRGADVVVRDGVIESVEAPGTASAAGAVTVDVAGRYVMPGLLSIHVHPGLMEGFRNDPNGLSEQRTRRDLAVWARFGVTTVQALGTDRDYAFDVARSRGPSEARLLTVGHGFGVRNGVPPKFDMDPPGPLRESDPVAIRAALERLRARGASGVKLWFDDWYGQMPKMARALAQLIIEVSSELGLRSYAHVYRVDDAKDLIRMGLRTLAHMPRDRVADDELWSLMKDRDVAVVPTLTVPDANVVYMDRPSFLEDPVVLANLPDGAKEHVTSDAYLASVRAKPEFGRLRQDLADATANVGGAYRAGAKIAFGTDAGVSQRIVGFGEHRELGMLVGAGMSPLDAIRSATVVAAEVLGRDDLGEIAPAKRADLVVLREDPLIEVRAMRSIESVWIDGERAAGALAP